MIYAVKVAISAIMIVLISEVSKKFPTLGGLIASLPLLSVLGMIWLFADTRNTEVVANHALSTFWFVLPSLPMFLLIPWLLRKGLPFTLALSLGCLLTIGLYVLMVFILKRFGINL